MITYILVVGAIVLLLWPGKKPQAPALIQRINTVPEPEPVIINHAPSFRAAMDAMHLVNRRLIRSKITPEQRAAIDTIVLGLMQGIEDEQ
jgi:hypothetical protein